ncbi:hypothetical protein LshimejAT787_0601620 [Lyophyllum shimeji]|uniref:Uncharacterized protein n=1 Tax=Lyophyllum shimeji TaxID=47721 RepID=A0A9P3PMD7_LYOSH|nr:hypothetical protein LshimejAT787_0601620 [Lyophyllum shimeji]
MLSRLRGAAGAVDRLLAERQRQFGKQQREGKGRRGAENQRPVKLALGLHLPIACANWLRANLGGEGKGGTEGWEAFARGVVEVTFREEFGSGTGAVAAETVKGSSVLVGLGRWLALGWFPLLKRVEFQRGLVARHMDKDLGEMAETCIRARGEERRFEGVAVSGVWRWVREGAKQGLVVGEDVKRT